VSAKTEEDFKKWEGWVGSRVKLLIQGIENCTNGQMLAHPGTARYKDPEKDENLHVILFLGLFPSSLKKKDEKVAMNLNPAVEQFQMMVTSWMDRATGESNWLPGMAAQVKHMKKKNLPSFVREEIDGYEKDLYDDILKEGEDGEKKKRKNASTSDLPAEDGEDTADAAVDDEDKADKAKAKKKKLAPSNDDDIVGRDDAIGGTHIEDFREDAKKSGAQQLKVSFAQAVAKNT